MKLPKANSQVSNNYQTKQKHFKWLWIFTQLGKSTETSNKPLMFITGTDENWGNDLRNAVTANLYLNQGPEPKKKPLHQNWVRRRTAMIQTMLEVQLKNGFLSYPLNWNLIGNALFMSFQKYLTLKEINNIKEFYGMKIAESHTRECMRFCNQWNENQLAVRIEILVWKVCSPNTHTPV